MEAFLGIPVLVRIAVHARTPVSDLRILRRGVDSSDCIERVRVLIELIVQSAECELA